EHDCLQVIVWVKQRAWCTGCRLGQPQPKASAESYSRVELNEGRMSPKHKELMAQFSSYPPPICSGAIHRRRTQTMRSAHSRAIIKGKPRKTCRQPCLQQQISRQESWVKG